MMRWPMTRLFILGTVTVLVFPLVLIAHERSHINTLQTVSAERRVAIVFGAGLKNATTPSDLLRDRLTVAADLYRSNKVDRILVSGDNRFVDYSEPDVMRDTLVRQEGIPLEDVFADYAGRRTYDTCKRAHTIWGVERAVLVSQAYHLPRALWTCRRFGIDGVGASASLRPYMRNDAFRTRELLAWYKAFLDVYLLRPSVIGGERETDLDL